MHGFNRSLAWLGRGAGVYRNRTRFDSASGNSERRRPRGLSEAALALATITLVACSDSSGGPSGGRGGGGGGGGGDGGPPPFEVNPGDVIGRVGLRLPSSQTFLLRATLPILPELWSPDARDGKVPFVIVDQEGFSVRTQVESVSRYPAAEDGTDVVELIARVQRPPMKSAGANALFEVAYVPTDPVEFEASQPVENLLQDPGNLVLSTRDVFGNRYSADLRRSVHEASDGVRWLRDGELARQSGTHEVLMPDTVVEGGTGTMPRMMGVHVFLTEWAGEDFFSLDLHVHNAGSGHDTEDPSDDALYEIFFDELLLEIPNGWTVLNALPDPYFGAPRSHGSGRAVPIVGVTGNATLHAMPRQARFQRRLVVARENAVERAQEMVTEQWLAFCRPVPGRAGQQMFSWWNQHTARFYPQNHRLPTLGHLGLDDLTAGLDGRFASIFQHVSEGTAAGYPVESAGLGWAHPWGVRYGGMTGGDEIALYDGFSVAATGSRSGYRLAQLSGRMYVDRQPTALINRDGKPTQVEDWLTENEGSTWIRMDFFLRPILPNEDPFGFGAAPTFQTETVNAQGRAPVYLEDLESYAPIDFQHYIRYTRNMKTLAWLGNDALAKLELEIAASIFRLGYHEYPTNWNGYAPGWGLKSHMNWVEMNPGWGLPFGRGNAWGLDAAVSAYALGDDDLRQRFEPWFELILETLQEGQSTCTGIIQASSSSKYDYLRIMQSFEASIVNNFLRSFRTSVFEGRDAAHAQMAKDVHTASLYAHVSPVVWREEYRGPVHWMAVAPTNLEQPPYCEIPPDDEQSHGADGVYHWSDLALGYELTGDPIFLDRAKQAAQTEDLYTHAHQSSVIQLSSRAPMLALMQMLNGE